jgi:anti-anti-sigma regulatory factor
MPRTKYKLSEDTLAVKGDLNAPLDVQFDIETRALLDSAKERGSTDLFIDLSEVTIMGSQYVGALAAVAAEAGKNDGTLTVRARGKAAELLKQCGLDRLMQLIIE